MSLRDAIRRVVEGATKEDRRLRIAIVVSVAIVAARLMHWWLNS